MKLNVAEQFSISVTPNDGCLENEYSYTMEIFILSQVFDVVGLATKASTATCNQAATKELRVDRMLALRPRNTCMALYP